MFPSLHSNVRNRTIKDQFPSEVRDLAIALGHSWQMHASVLTLSHCLDSNHHTKQGLVSATAASFKLAYVADQLFQRRHLICLGCEPLRNSLLRPSQSSGAFAPCVDRAPGLGLLSSRRGGSTGPSRPPPWQIFSKYLCIALKQC